MTIANCAKKTSAPEEPGGVGSEKSSNWWSFAASATRLTQLQSMNNKREREAKGSGICGRKGTKDVEYSYGRSTKIQSKIRRRYRYSVQ